MPVNVTSFEGIDLDDDQVELLRTLRDYVDRDVLPHVREYEEPDVFPEAMVQPLREMGAFGMRIPAEYGGMGLDLVTYALAIAELSRGWTSISGIVNGQYIVGGMIASHGTPEQKQRYLPRMAAGDFRAAFSMTEPEAGSDVQAIRTTAPPRRRRVRHRRHQDVGHQRPALLADRGAGQDRPRRLAGAPRDDGVPGREGAGGRDAGRPHHPAAAAQARLQGRRVDGARLRRPSRARGRRARRRGGARTRASTR